MIPTTQPIISHATLYKIAGGAIIGLLTAVGVDLHSFGQSPAGSKWNWQLTVAHALYGAIAGGLGAIGVSIAAQ